MLSLCFTFLSIFSVAAAHPFCPLITHVLSCVCWKVSERLTLPGVALGLAWTPLGGEIMFVEASRMEGDGQLTLTGQLGDVMKESAHLAISWLRTNAKTYNLTNSEFTRVYT